MVEPQFQTIPFNVASVRVMSTVPLVALVLQNTGLVLLMKQSYRPSALEYSTAAVVALAEGLKMFVCFIVCVKTEGLHSTLKALRSTPAQLNLGLPCVLYAVQNNLLFFAVQNLPTTMYVVCSQGKIISSAFFSFYILNTKLTRNKVLGLLLLICGMVLVQLPDGLKPSFEYDSDVGKGLAAIIFACCTSGFAGVYLEKLYKGKGSLQEVSVMTKNMQLSCFSLPISLLLAIIKDFEVYKTLGFFHGIDKVVVLVLCFQALGGIIVAIVMRHASNLLKCFAVSISICLCSIISVTRGEEKLSARLIMGVSLVNAATLLFSSAQGK